MKKFIFSALCAMAMVSCTTQKAAMDITGSWSIEKAMGKSTVGAETAPFIQFDKDGKMHGNASVNNFFGSYKLDGDKLSFSNVGMTRMMGADMKIEDAISEALDLVSTVKTSNNNAFVFSEKNDTLLVLKKQ